MIHGAHFLLYSSDPEADQAALQAILATRSVQAGEGRSIFALPPGEIATHDGHGDFKQHHASRELMGIVLYLMCDDLASTIEALKAENLRCTQIEETEFGAKTTIVLPSGGEIGLYQPSHETALERDRDRVDP